MGKKMGKKKVGYEIRKNTIGKELKLLTKKNRINDRRLGQNNPTLSAAQKSELRFIAQRKHLTDPKKTKFLLNDEEDNLEHLVSNLTEAEKFQRGVGNEAYEEEDLDPELMAQASFGGGSLTQFENNDHSGRRLSRKEIVKEAIKQSKQSKALRQHDKAIQLDQWEKLDQQFSELKESGELAFGRAKIENEEGDDDYMDLYQQLGFDNCLPANREWASDITRKDVEEKEAEILESKKQTLFKSKEKLTFPMAVDAISSTQIENSWDLAQMLLICHDVAVFLEDNKRYCPEVIGFLLNTLMLANSSTDMEDDHENLLSNFPTGEGQDFIYFAEKVKVKEIPPISVNALKESNDSGELNEGRLLDLQVVRLCVRLVRFFSELYDNIFEAYPIIFGQFKAQLEKLPVKNYPKVLSKEVKETLKIVQEKVEERSKVTHLHKSVSQKIKMIDMLEPRMEEHFNARHPSHRRDDPKAGLKRLQKRIKSEQRGAVRELRGDARFIAGEQSKVRREVDEERTKKTTRIMASLQTQESEYKKRKKGKKF
jgi:hypothetical protein